MIKKLLSESDTIFNYERKLFIRTVDFIKQNAIKFEILLVVLIFLLLVAQLPYFNIFLQNYMILFILVILAVYLLRIQKNQLLWLTLILFGVTAIYAVWGLDKDSENLGNLIYFFLWLVFILNLKDLWNK